MQPHRTEFVLFALSAGLVVAGSMIGLVGFWYGQAWIEWDSAGASNFYTERPAGFVVLLATQAWMLTICLYAVGLFVVGCARLSVIRPNARRHAAARTVRGRGA